MVPGHGSLPAEKIKELYVARIERFGLNFNKHVINSTNDGCSTMIKLKKELKKLMQLCLVHGIQLGIVKIVYVDDKENTVEIEVDQTNVESDDDEEEYTDESEDDETEANNEDTDDTDDNQWVDIEDESDIEEPETENLPELKREYKKAIRKWRKIVKTYHGRSTVKKDHIQDAIKGWQKTKVNN